MLNVIIKKRSVMCNRLIGPESEAIDQSDSEKLFDWSRATKRWTGSTLIGGMVNVEWACRNLRVSSKQLAHAQLAPAHLDQIWPSPTLISPAFQPLIRQYILIIHYHAPLTHNHHTPLNLIHHPSPVWRMRCTVPPSWQACG